MSQTIIKIAISMLTKENLTSQRVIMSKVASKRIRRKAIKPRQQ